ncbi:hypothetical protein FDUTEX481_02100 [Tolypothrix sp. PCC 7601]|nr:hypothetical protein FDUTEX481_02100 [Tolypothrix sp. PCC 7601]
MIAFLSSKPFSPQCDRSSTKHYFPGLSGFMDKLPQCAIADLIIRLCRLHEPTLPTDRKRGEESG